MEDQLTEQQPGNTQRGNEVLSRKDDVTATRYNVKLRTMTWTGLNWLRYGPIVCFCNDGYESSSYVKSRVLSL
jgi:hypothetical protein